MTPAAPDTSSAAAGVLLGLVCGLLVAAVAFILVLSWLLRRPLKRVPEEHRKLPLWSIGLIFVPVVNLVWAFMIALRVPASIRAALDAQGSSEGGDCGRGVGLAWAISSGLSGAFVLVNLAQDMSRVLRGEGPRAAELPGATGGLQMAAGWIGLGALVLLVIFLVQISAASKKLVAK